MGTARNIELYSLAYRLALKQISELQKPEQPNIALRLHASIRRQLKKGANDPFFIAVEALIDLVTFPLDRALELTRHLLANGLGDDNGKSY